MNFLSRKSTIFILTALFIPFFAQQAKGPIDVGNGGDLIECRNSGESRFSGFYMLDYVATYNSAVGDAYFEPISPDPMITIAEAIKKEIPKLGSDLELFIEDFQAQFAAKVPDYFRKHIWIPVENGLEKNPDSYLSQDEIPPQNCLNPSTGKVDFLQAVIRDDRSRSVIYKYDPKLIANIADPNHRLQMSFLIIHEWLWQFAPNARILRDANRLVQSTAFRGYTGKQMMASLQNLGMVFDPEELGPIMYTFAMTNSDLEKIPVKEFPVDSFFGTKVVFTNPVEGIFEISMKCTDCVDSVGGVIGPEGCGEHKAISLTTKGPAVITVQSYLKGSGSYVQNGSPKEMVVIK